jgi:hypothetical protein
MDKTLQELTTKIADYIERTQPLIDSQNEQRSNFVKRATQAAGVLAHRGVIDARRVNEFIDKVAADPSAVWEFVEKLAAALPTDNLGEAVQQKVASGAKVDAFERIFFGRGAEKSGMVD